MKKDLFLSDLSAPLFLFSSFQFCFADQLLPVHLKKVNIARKQIEKVGRLFQIANFSGHNANI